MEQVRNIEYRKIRLHVYCMSILLIFILLCQSIIAQTTNEITREFTLNNKKFIESFEYISNNNHKEKNGYYKLLRIQHDSVKNENFESSVFNGNFKNNHPEGIWSLSDGQYEMTNEIVFENHKYANKTNGLEFSCKGIFENGKKEGNWNYNQWKIKDSNVDDTLSHLLVNYKNDKVSGTIILDNKKFLIEINLDDNGLPQGVWRYYLLNENKKKTLIKELFFEDNILREKILYDIDKSYHIVLDTFSLDNTSLVTIPVDDNFFRILKLKSIIANNDLNVRDNLLDETNKLFLESIHFINTLDTIFKNISENTISPSIYAKLYKYNINEKEKEYFNQLTYKVKNLDSIIKSILKTPQINLAKISNVEIEKNITILKAFDSIMLKPIDSIVNLYQNGTLEYLNRPLFIERFLSAGRKIDLTFEHQLDPYFFLPNNKFESSESCKNLILFFDEVQIEITSTIEHIEKFIFQARKENRLFEKESRLLELYESIIYLNKHSIPNQLNTLAGFEVDDIINTFVSVELKNYNELSDATDKMKLIGSYISCFENIEKLIISLKKTPLQNDYIKEKYVKNVFNPYISDYMEEVTKPNIYSAYKEILMPKIFELLKSMNCSNIDLAHKNLENIHNGMLRVLNEDTRKIERKVKKEKDPFKVSELLNFNLMFE